MFINLVNCELTEEDIDTLIAHKHNNLYTGNVSLN